MDYIAINKALWNARTELHIDSAFYDMGSFLKGQNSLKEIELALLGDVSGKSVLHLQCHFGQDTLSLARMGAEVTGVDFSDKAIETATKLSEDLAIPATFICCDLYDLPQHLDKKFDYVFTSYGTIGWLPDIDKWASVVSRFLKTNGKFIFAEFHPVVWMFDDNFDHVAYNYSNSDPIVETISGSYADRNGAMQQQSVGWNHGLAEVISALLKNGLSIESFREYDYSPYNCLPGLEEVEPGKFRVKKLGNHIPMVYSLTAVIKTQADEHKQ